MFSFTAYVLTDDITLRDLDGATNSLAIGDILSNALQPDILKKELRPGDYMVSKLQNKYR